MSHTFRRGERWVADLRGNLTNSYLNNIAKWFMGE